MNDEIVKIAFSYFRLLSENRVAEAIDTLDDRGTWWSTQRRVYVPMNKFKEGLARSFELMPLEFALHDVIAVNGSRVVMEIESFGTRPSGEPYNNFYCFINDVLGDKILTVREHADMRQGATLPPEIKSLHKH